MDQSKQKKKLRLSIRIKTVIVIIVFALVLAEVAMLYFIIVLSRSNEKTYKNLSDNIANTVAEVINEEQFYNVKTKVKSIVDASPNRPLVSEWGSDEWNAYMAQFAEIETDTDFLALRNYLREVQKVNLYEIDCIYLSYVDPDLELFVYVLDSDTIDYYPPGCLDVLETYDTGILKDLNRGFPADISNSKEYGWIVTSGAPVYHNNELVGYAMVDVSMTAVRAEQTNRIMRLFFYLLATIVILCAVGITVVHFVLNKPIKTLITTVKTYDLSDPESTHNVFQQLKINTRDELEDLAITMKKMENDIYNKINELIVMNKELVESQKVAAKMTELANKDALTGVRNKAAYDEMVKKINGDIALGGTPKFGIAMVDLNYLKMINDEFGHDNGDAALIKLCSLICTIFAHSPVFRIGGDEFVIILRHTDYNRVDKLITEFNDKIDGLNQDEFLTPAEKVSAAIGYAKFNPETDKCVDDVFKRADKAMYERKHFMKERDEEHK